MEKSKINISEIRELIPHREPFIFIDELIDIVKLKKARFMRAFFLVLNEVEHDLHPPYMDV